MCGKMGVWSTIVLFCVCASNPAYKFLNTNCLALICCYHNDHGRLYALLGI